MSNLTTVVNNIVSKVNTHTTDLSNKATQISTHIPLSGITAYHLLQGNLAVSASTITQGFNTTLYTSSSATTGIDMDTQWGNTAEEKFGGLVWLKDRVEATNNFLYDTVRGATKEINSNTTEAEATLASGLTAFNSTGFTVGADTGHNSTTNNMVSWNFQTTHRTSGVTNHGKPYTCHYNPFTGFTMVKYTGSGIAGHEIPHNLSRKLDLWTFKNLTSANSWEVHYSFSLKRLNLNTTDAEVDGTSYTSTSDKTVAFINATHADWNTSGNQYIMYGWSNSYFDESNKLIGNYEIGVYQGTGATGNKVTTRGKPAWVMRKRLDAIGDWVMFDSLRTSSGNFLGRLFANTSQVEATNEDHIDVVSDGFIANYDSNISGGQYLYLVAYDTNANGGGSYYPLAIDTANVQVNNALIPIAQGIDSNGAKNTILSKNETFSGVTYTQGKNYPYYDALGNRGVSVHKPRYLESELIRTYAGETPDYYNVKENKWYSTSGGSELITNGAFTSNVSGWTAYLGGTITWVSGVARVHRSTDGNSGAYKEVSVPIGVPVKVSASITKGNDNFGVINIRDILSGATLKQIRSDGIKEVTVVSSTGSLFLMVTSDSNGLYCEIDNISVFEAVIKPTTEITNGRNYLNHIVYADNDGGVLYVEELPKIEYKDIVKANEFKGKNACTAWVNFDGTTTPPTIRDSYNVKGVVRTGTGLYDIYFENKMDNTNYSTVVNQSSGRSSQYCKDYIHNVDKVSIQYLVATTAYDEAVASLHIFGGKN